MDSIITISPIIFSSQTSAHKSHRLPKQKTKLIHLLWRAQRGRSLKLARSMAATNGIDPQAKTLKLENVGYFT